MAYVRIDNLDFYYEAHGRATTQPPLVLLHGGDPTIQTSFAHLMPEFAKRRQVIAFEQAGHGRTADRPAAPFSFEQSADDTAALMTALGVQSADFLGYSNGGTIALQIAIRHPRIARKLIIMSANYRADGMHPWFWDSMKSATLASMPPEFQEAYRRTSPHPERLQSYFEKSTKRMLEFKDIADDALKAIQAPALIVLGDRDVVTPEHAAAMQRLIPNAELAILPNTDHMQMVERSGVLVPMVEQFLEAD
jgi:pimeloyl-ACP methyl ester carboxylesterase